MSQELVLAALGIGGGYWLLQQHEAAASYPVGSEAAQPTYTAESSRERMAVAQASGFLNNVNKKKGWTFGAPPLDTQGASLYNDPGSKVAQTFQGDAVYERAKREYNALSEAAKCAGLEKLKAEFAGKPESVEIAKLTCKSGFDQVAGAVGGFAGAAGASQGCQALGAGGAALSPLCGAVGKVVGSYIGERIDDWAEWTWDKLGDAMPWNW